MKANLLTTLTFCALLSGPGFADDKAGKHDHDHDPGGGHHHATIVAPDSLPELWARINAHGKTVAAAAAAGNMAVVHKEQVNLEALIAALAPLSKDLDAAKLNRVEGMISNSRRALGQLHEAADAGDAKALEKSAKRLTGVLAILKAQYPREVTAGMAEVIDDIGPHEGVLAEFKGAGGNTAGYLELKLHNDKGDLELWLARDSAITRPFDLPAGTKITVDFKGAKNDRATLAVRNTGKNEDEDGNPNMRGGKTNYFIFPGDSGADPSWLMGGEFRASVSVSFSSPAGEFATDSFPLTPHTHHDHNGGSG